MDNRVLRSQAIKSKPNDRSSRIAPSPSFGSIRSPRKGQFDESEVADSTGEEGFGRFTLFDCGAGFERRLSPLPIAVADDVRSRISLGTIDLGRIVWFGY